MAAVTRRRGVAGRLSSADIHDISLQLMTPLANSQHGVQNHGLLEVASVPDACFSGGFEPRFLVDKLPPWPCQVDISIPSLTVNTGRPPGNSGMGEIWAILVVDVLSPVRNMSSRHASLSDPSLGDSRCTHFFGCESCSGRIRQRPKQEKNCSHSPFQIWAASEVPTEPSPPAVTQRS